MLDNETIKQLKAEYGVIFSVKLFGSDYVFRPLKVREYRDIVDSAESSADKEEMVVTFGTVWPEDLTKLMSKAGAVSALASEILECSDFFDVKASKSVFDGARAEAQDVVSIMKALILAVHQELNLVESDVDNMTFSQLAKKAALAEQILTIKKVVNDPNMEFNLEIVDPEEALKADKELQQREFEKVLNTYDPDLATTLGAASTNDPLAAKLQADLHKAKEQGLI